MSIPIAHPHLAAELWISLRALAVSHVAMHSVAYPHDAWIVLSSDASALAIASAHALLQWNAPAANGVGNYQVTAAHPDSKLQRGTFHFTADGFVCLGNDTATFEMEAAVEKILSTLKDQERRA